MKKKAKVAVFVDGDFIPSYDGASNRFHYLSRYLVKNGMNLIVFHGYRGWSDMSLIKKEPFKTYVFPTEHYYNNLELIASILIREGVDIIQFDNLEPVLLQGIRLSQLTGAKLVSEMHYVVRNLAKRLGADNNRLLEIENIEKEVGKSIDHLICLSEQDKPFLLHYMNINPERISVIPSGVDCSEIKYHKPDLENKNVVFLGNLYFKPNEDAIRVIKEKIYPKLKESGFKFTIGGDCPLGLKKELEDDNFTFIGVIPDLNTLFNNATFALSPVAEGTGMRIKILNYLAAGVPVITTSIASNGFPQKDFLIIEDDYTKYANIILELYKDKRRMNAISKNGLKIIKNKYDWNIISKQAIKIYKGILGQEYKKKILNKDILKIKEPAWLQEAIAKNRFKQIINNDLPQNFSYCIFENGNIRPYLLENIVAIEGMPGAGKTTFIDNYIKKNNIKFLPQLGIKDSTVLAKNNLNTSKLFLINEKKKTDLIMKYSSDNQKVVIDRTFLTTLAYCYARSKLYKNKDYEKLLSFYKKTKANITFPTKLIFLDVKIKESIKRRKRYSNNSIYSNWFSEEFLKYMHEFYNKELSKFILLDIFRIDTTNMTIKKAEDVLREKI